MSQFEGNKLKVRCTDCTKLSDIHCVAKNTKVSPKKTRLCAQYNFKGEYENRTPAQAVYMPHVDKKTQRMLKKLLKMGVVSVAGDAPVDPRAGFEHTKTLDMPASTATAAIVGTKIKEDPILNSSEQGIVEPGVVFQPTGEGSNGSEDNRS